jgi:hypothetical protein
MKEIANYVIFTVGSRSEITVLTIMLFSWIIFFILSYITALYLHFYYKRNIYHKLKAYPGYMIIPNSFYMRVGLFGLCIFFQRYRDRCLASYPLHKKVPFKVALISAFTWFLVLFSTMNLIVGSIFLHYVD